jgi:hypothetical protein
LLRPPCLPAVDPFLIQVLPKAGATQDWTTDSKTLKNRMRSQTNLFCAIFNGYHASKAGKNSPGANIINYQLFHINLQELIVS